MEATRTRTKVTDDELEKRARELAKRLLAMLEAVPADDEAQGAP